jgi:chitosanase
MDRRCLLALVLVGCGGTTTTPPGDDDPGLTAPQKRVAEALTSIWENDTPELDYAYAENIDDGRGYTSGRAGFCTGTGDAIQVVACFDDRRPDNLLAKYMPALMEIDARYQSTGDDQASTAELDAVGDWVSDWAASDGGDTRADFRACQDQIVDELYYQPAMDAAATWGLTSALSKAALYDMWINQGDDELIAATNDALGDTDQVAPVVGYMGITEDAWLQTFLETRRDLLWGDDTWMDAVDRVAGYEKQRRLGNFDLSAAVRNDVRALDCWSGDFASSEYTVREIAPDGSFTTPADFTYGCQ